MIKGIHTFLSKMLPLFHSSLILLPLGCTLFISSENFPKTNKVCILVIAGIISLITYLVAERKISMERVKNKLSVDILKGERNIAEHRCDMIFKMFEGVLKRKETHLS